MKVLVPGHRYELTNFENKSEPGQILQFIHKEPKQVEGGGTELELVSDGTSNEDLIKVLIDRMQFLNQKFPCRENSMVITKLDEALMWLEKRTRDRERRGVEGKHLA